MGQIHNFGHFGLPFLKYRGGWKLSASSRLKVAFLFLTTLSLLISELCWIVIVIIGFVGVEDLAGATINHYSASTSIFSTLHRAASNLIFITFFWFCCLVFASNFFIHSPFLYCFVEWTCAGCLCNYSFKLFTPVSVQSTTICIIFI